MCSTCSPACANAFRKSPAPSRAANSRCWPIALIRETLVRLKEQGVAIILVEQRVDAVLSIADRVTFVENGTVALIEDAAALKDNEALFHRYIGV